MEEEGGCFEMRYFCQTRLSGCEGWLSRAYVVVRKRHGLQSIFLLGRRTDIFACGDLQTTWIKMEKCNTDI